MRSVFSTGTAKTATVAAIAGFLAAVTPNIANIAERIFPARKADIADVQQIAIQAFGLASLLGGGLAIANRASATDKVYSPNWLPGFNKKQLEQLEQLEQEQIVVSAAPPLDMHEQVRQMAAQQFGPVDFAHANVRVPEGVALPPIDMGSQRQVFTNPQDAI